MYVVIILIHSCYKYNSEVSVYLFIYSFLTKWFRRTFRSLLYARTGVWMDHQISLFIIMFIILQSRLKMYRCSCECAWIMLNSFEKLCLLARCYDYTEKSYHTNETKCTVLNFCLFVISCFIVLVFVINKSKCLCGKMLINEEDHCQNNWKQGISKYKYLNLNSKLMWMKFHLRFT